MLEQEFGSLKTFRQRLAHRLLDHPGSGKADQRIRLRDHHVAEKRETRRDATHGWIGQHRNEGKACAGQLRQRCSGLRHLHQRHQALLHARPTARREADERQVLFAAALHAAYETFADHRAHRTAEKAKLERGNDQRNVLDGPLHHHQGIVFPGIRPGLLEAFGVTPAVNELQEIDRPDFGADFELAFRVECQVNAFARGEPVVMPAFRAYVQILVEVSTIEHRFADFALAPKAFGHHLLDGARGALDFRRQQFLQPAHPGVLMG